MGIKDLKEGNLNVAHLLDDHINRLGEVKSLVFEDKEYTNTWLQKQSNRLANGLRSLGVENRDKVVVSLQNCPQVLIVYQAILRIGAVIAPVMFQMNAEEVEFILTDCDASVFITNHEASDKIEKALNLSQISHVISLEGQEDERIISYEKLIETHPEEMVIADTEAGDLALLIYTAGTTGKPKGVMLSHSNLYHNATATYDLWESEPRRQLSCLPLAHMFGVTAMLIDQLNRHRDSVFVLMKGFDPPEIFRLIEKYGITGMGGVPTMFWLMLYEESADKYDQSSLQRCVVGSAPVMDELYKDFEKKFDVELIEAYGLSESCSAVACTHSQKVRKSGSAGTAIGSTVIKIFDEADKELPPGEPGEIVIRGPTVMKGYHKRPDESQEAIRNGWLHTGDMGQMDEDGYLFITDRKKDMIIKGGENIYPSEVENIILGHDKVLETAVIGIPDQKYGEEVLAFIVTKPGEELSEDEIVEFCRQNYTKFKCPSQIRFTDNLPKSLVGKILKKELRKQLE